MAIENPKAAILGAMLSHEEKASVLAAARREPIGGPNRKQIVFASVVAARLANRGLNLSGNIG